MVNPLKQGATFALESEEYPVWYSAGYSVPMAATIKVSGELRDRINRDAQERGVTAAGLIERLLDAHERRERMEAFGRSIRDANPAYWDEFRSWDVTLDDGGSGG